MTTGKREKPFKLDMSFGEALARFAGTRPDEVEAPTRTGKPAKMEPSQGEFELVHYQTPDCQADFRLDPSNETVWATQQQIADAFGITTNTVGEHLGNIFREGELGQEATTRKFRGVSRNGREINLLHYSLDAILSVGYRVSSKRATAFRQWATGVLKDYLVQGFALNESRLKDDPHALRELAAKVRALRADEKNIYRGVRDVFKEAAIDYDPNTQAARIFFATLQDKFIYAITGEQAAQVILDRAHRDEPRMGLQATKGERITVPDIHIGKNYLDRDELYQLHILCEQFLLFVESRAIRGSKLTMNEMSEKFNDLLTVQGHPVFHGYQDYLKDKAKAHAEREFAAYRQKALKNPPVRR